MTIDYARLSDVSVDVSVELGRTRLTLREIAALGEDSIVALDRLTDELLDVTANGQPIAKAEVIAQDGKFALRIVELAGGGPRPDPVSTKPATDEPTP